MRTRPSIPLMAYETIRFTVEAGVARIVLDRPKANAFSPVLSRELRDAAVRCDVDPEVRAVVLTGVGRFFSAGGDLAAFASAESASKLLFDMTHDIHAAVAHFHRMAAPVIVAVNGTAAGGGLSLCLGGDVVIAAETAKLTMGYPKVGLSPDGTSSYFLPRLVGLRRAQELMFTDRVLTAEEGREWGLVTKVVPAEELESTVAALAERLANGPTRAYGAAKNLLSTTFGNGLAEQAELESRWIAELAASPDGQEGIGAFLEGRKPSFTGR